MGDQSFAWKSAEQTLTRVRFSVLKAMTRISKKRGRGGEERGTVSR